MKSNAVGRGVSCEIVSRDIVKEMCPILHVDDLKGALWVPGDGLCNPLEVCSALIHLAYELGVKVVPFCEVRSTS